MANSGDTNTQSGSCTGEWHYPRHCVPENGTCEYTIQWTYKGKKVAFYPLMIQSFENTQ